jgi:hypothetical protein
VNRLYPTSETEEILILFDCRFPGTRNRLYRERRAWGSRATVENLGRACAMLIIRPGGALEVRR